MGSRGPAWLQMSFANLPSFLSQEKDSNIANFTQKVESLEAELQDLSSQESKDEASLAKVRKQLRDLEAKVKDQEEELDEQAGTIQMLEQVRLRRGSAHCLQTLALPVFWACQFRRGVCHPIHLLPLHGCSATSASLRG